MTDGSLEHCSCFNPLKCYEDFWSESTDGSTFSHINNAVGNKLCHLLADGDDDFRGSSFSPLDADLMTSISATANLFYEVQVNRLASSADYYDLGDVLEQAVKDASLGLINLGDDISWNAIAVQRVINAITAVEVDGP